MRHNYEQRVHDIYTRSIRAAHRYNRLPLGKHGRRQTAQERRAVQRRIIQARRRGIAAGGMFEWDDEDTDESCWRCGGQGWGILGTDWDNDDPINDPDGIVEQCRCCGGTGLAEDCVYW